MSYVTIENFKFGLDSRRSELTSLPGTLQQCENAHVNQGGEIEKRKAFVMLPNSPITPPDKGMGLEVDSTVGPVFFVDLTSFVTGPISQIALNLDVGDPVVQVVASTNFGGKTFCLGKTFNGKYRWYYDGEAITESWIGEVWPATTSIYFTAQNIGTAFLAALTNSGFQITEAADISGVTTILTTGFTQPAVGGTTGSIHVGTSIGFTIGQLIFVDVGGYYVVASKPDTTHVTLTNTGLTDNAAPGVSIPVGSSLYMGQYIDIKAPANQSFTLDVTANSAAGHINKIDMGQGHPTIPGASAFATITINSGANQGVFNSIVAPISGGGTVGILGAAVHWTTDEVTTAALLAQAINTTTSVPKYSASASGNVVTIFAPKGAGYNGGIVTINYNGNVGDDMDFNTVSGPLKITISPTTASILVQGLVTPSHTATLFTNFVTAYASGGIPPYRFNWGVETQVTTPGPGVTTPTLIFVSDPVNQGGASSKVQFFAQVTLAKPTTGFAFCSVTDSATNPATVTTVNIPVSITLAV